MGVVRNVGNLVKNGVNRLNYVNPVLWGILPGVIFGILILLFFIFVFKLPITGTSEKKVCDADGKNCHTEMKSNSINLVFYIVFPIVIGIVLGAAIFRLVFYIKNPKTGMALVTVGMFRQAISGK